MGQESKKPSQGGLLAVVVFFLVAFASLVISQILGLTSDGGRAAEAIWAIFILTTSGGAAITAILILTYLHNLHANSASVVEDLRQLKSGQTQNEAMLTQISENLLLSDAVKSVAFRENDRAVLIEAIPFPYQGWFITGKGPGKLLSRLGRNTGDFLSPVGCCGLNMLR